MKVLFDSSVLVAAMTAKHVHHETALTWATRASSGQIEAFMSTHTLAELYSVLTGHPHWRIAPEACLESLTIIQAYIKPVALSTKDYAWALQRMTSLGLPGGSVYDALHARASLKKKVDILLSLNTEHFVRLGEDVAKLVQTP